MTTLPNTTVVWDAYACKNYLCLAAPRGGAISGCDGCFDLRHERGKQQQARWARDDGALSYSNDAVRRAQPNDTVRIGLDLSSGSPSGTFAARGPPCSPRPSTPARRSAASSRRAAWWRCMSPPRTGCPCSTWTSCTRGTSSVAAGGWPRVYRVLRPGALFWLDHLNCAAAQPNAMFAPLLDHVSDFASVSFWLPAHTSEHLHASDSDCSIMWAASVTHKKFAARCGLPQQL